MTPVAGTSDASTRFCAVCGAWGAFGFDDLPDRPARYACFTHRDQVERMRAAPAPRDCPVPANGGAEVAA